MYMSDYFHQLYEVDTSHDFEKNFQDHSTVLSDYTKFDCLYHSRANDRAFPRDFAELRFAKFQIWANLFVAASG